MALKDEINMIKDYCEKKLRAEKRISMIVENPFTDTIPWTRSFSYIYINFSEKSLPNKALLYNSVEKKLEVYEEGEFYEIEEYLNRSVFFD